MNAETLLQAIGELDETIIADARMVKKRENWVKWAAAAAALALAVVAVALWGREAPTTAPDAALRAEPSASEPNQPEVHLVVNQPTGFSGAVLTAMDVRQTAYGELTQEERETFSDYTGVELDELVASLPAGLECRQVTALRWLPDEKENAGQLRDYVLDCGTADGGWVRIALCPTGKPMRDYVFICEGEEPSKINETSLTVYGSEGMYLAFFFHDGLYYDVETRGIDAEQLERLLIGLLA